MTMIEFILSNINAIGSLVVLFGLLLWALWTRQWDLLRITAYSLMLQAERLMATKQGKAKMDVVFVEIWQRLPVWLKRFVTEQTLRDKLQGWYNIAKNSLGDETI